MVLPPGRLVSGSTVLPGRVESGPVLGRTNYFKNAHAISVFQPRRAI